MSYHLLHELLLFFFNLAPADLVTPHSCLKRINPFPTILFHLAFCRPFLSFSFSGLVFLSQESGKQQLILLFLSAIQLMFFYGAI